MPSGIWTSSPERKLLWAAERTLHHIEKAVPERRDIARWRRRIKRLMNDPVQEFDWAAWHRRQFEKARDPDVPDEIQNQWAALPDEIAGGLWEDAAVTRLIREGLPFDRRELAQSMAGTFNEVKGIVDTERDALRRMMKEAIDEQKGQFAFARRIKSEFAGFSTKRSQVVAITEWNRAASVATRLAYERQGVEFLRWFTAQDQRVCPICEGNEGAGEVSIKDGFPSGHDEPPAHPSCRCNISSA